MTKVGFLTFSRKLLENLNIVPLSLSHPNSSLCDIVTYHLFLHFFSRRRVAVINIYYIYIYI
jgi:hypothetical protein